MRAEKKPCAVPLNHGAMVEMDYPVPSSLVDVFQKPGS